MRYARSVTEVARHREVQAAAKAVLAALGESITARDYERNIAERAAALLAAAGFADTWYYKCPALVLLGTRSCLSVSGRDYVPSDELVGEHNLVTVDLSPRREAYWGDCARSFCIENGRHSPTPSDPVFRDGLALERELHTAMQSFATRTTTCDALFQHCNALIRARGFENLDFRGNLGHSIVQRLEDRAYIEAGSARRLGDMGLFTFEPHIRTRGGRWGFKHEDIYYFDDLGKLATL